MVDAQIARCAEVRADMQRLRAEVYELKALSHPRAAFAAALFELDQARNGDPVARAAMLDVADSLLTFWKDKSGGELASTHPALAELWQRAVGLLAGFQAKRFQRQLDACWEARAEAAQLTEAVAALGTDDDRRAEFARCLYHLELARLHVDSSRIEFARRAALVQEAYREAAVADELVGNDPGLSQLWGELHPYLDEFFETLDEAKARAAAAAAAEAEPLAIEPEAVVTAPTPFPAPSPAPMPPPLPPILDGQADVAAEAAAPPEVAALPPLPPELPPPPPDPSVPDGWPELASMRSPPVPYDKKPRFFAPPTAPVEVFDINKTLPIDAEPPAGLRESLVTQRIEVPANELVEEVISAEAAVDIHKTLPPPPPSETLPPGVTVQQLEAMARAATGDTLDPDLVQEVAPRPTSASAPFLAMEEEDPDPGPLTQAFWRGTEAALGLLPPTNAPRLNTRVFAADSSKERKRLTGYLDDVKSRFTEAEVPESRAMQCLIKLYLAAHSKEKTLFGSKNEKRVEGFRSALSMMSADAMAASRCAVWFELDGDHTVDKLNEALMVVWDYLAYCSVNHLDPLAPTSPALFLS